MNIGAGAALIGFIGDPVAQGKAPLPLTRLLQSRGIDAVVVPMRVPAADFDSTCAALLRVRNFAGCVITVPHKQAAARCARLPLGTVVRAGVANVMRRSATGEWEADLLDGAGFVSGMRSRGREPGGLRAAILGAGGAGAAIAFALADEGARRLRVHDIDRARAQQLVDRLCASGAAAELWDGRDAANLDLLVNATPVGMGAAVGLPIDPDLLRPGLIVAEAIMEPEITPLLAEARLRGCSIHPGRYMLEGQLEPMARFFAAACGSCASAPRV